MGFSNEGFDVPLYGSEESLKEIKEKLCIHARGIPFNELVVKIKSSDHNNFKVMFILLIMYTILALGLRAMIPHRYLHGAVDVGHICKRNWSKWSLSSWLLGLGNSRGIVFSNMCVWNFLFMQVHYNPYLFRCLCFLYVHIIMNYFPFIF